MSGIVRDTAAMIAGMRPLLTEGTFVFALSEDMGLLPEAMAFYREAEGPAWILPLAVAEARGLDTALPMRCITLQVNSALDGIGLTAAVAGALTEAGIPCNMVAATRHDHVYVPADKADAALACLQALSAGG
ncbi:ACT domain-containing protein [Pseudooceanicola sp. LIPI14-2-Ac024]|uniref:ACT domain-containing protein n=1 Tax=Pseudooceanicola sp. LIPI14-2-Ac024 TaxID=3344875 RepID=UPI0035CEEC81